MTDAQFQRALRQWRSLTEATRQFFRRYHGGNINGLSDLAQGRAGDEESTVSGPIMAPGNYTPAELDQGFPDDGDGPQEQVAATRASVRAGNEQVDVRRRADPVPGFDIDRMIDEVASFGEAFRSQRETLRAARNPATDPSDPAEDHAAPTDQGYKEARAQLRAAAENLLYEIEIDEGIEQEPPNPW